MSTIASEGVLIARAGDGDGKAYAALLQEHADVARRVALSITRSEADAEEATQEAFLKAFHALPRFRAGAPFRPWLLRIVANEAHNVVRSSARQARLSRAAAAQPQQVVPAADEQLLAAEQRQALVAALERLPREDRVAILGRYVAELEVEETATLLEVRPATARVRVFRALRRLQRELAIAGAVVLALAVALAVSPGARSAALSVLDRIPGLTIDRVDQVHEFGSDVAGPYQGERVPLDYALMVTDFRPRGLDQPVHVAYTRNDVQGGMVTLAYASPAVSVTEWSAAPSSAAFEVLRDGATVEEVEIGGVPGVWIEGGARATYTFIGADGQRHHEALATDRPLLLWQRDGIAFRLEGAADRDLAVTLAEALRPL
jgi:RNA polymerase sigma-70 factor (ECF subfamily)